MTNTSGPDGENSRHRIYQIRIQGHLGRHWAERFEGMRFRLEKDGSTLLTGPVVDQAALHGMLRTIRDLGMELLSVNSIGADESNLVQHGKVSDE